MKCDKPLFKPLPIGGYDFKSIIEKGSYYVDKTLLIKELLDRDGKVTLFTRPRRFGKTMNMYMLKYFFEAAVDRCTGEIVDNSYLFNGLKIMSAGEEYLKHMGKYPVIFISLNTMKQMEFDGAVRMLMDDLAEEYKRHSYILGKIQLNEEELDFYNRMCNKKFGIAECKEAILTLSKMLEAYHGVGPVILIDEYDVPLQWGYEQGTEYYAKVLDLIRGMFEKTFKNNPYMSFGVLTGCLRVSRESIFTGFNNLEIVSILTKSYGEYFGFTSEEVVKMMNDFNVAERVDEARDWYNGYVFGKVNIYNPWSILKYVQDLRDDINSLPSPHWANTSSNSIVKEMISHIDESVQEELELLMNGGTVEKPVHEDITYAELEYDVTRHEEYMDNLYNFMFFTGYFRKVSERMEDESKYITLALPNREVRYIFNRHITNWFNVKMYHWDRSPLLQAVLNHDTEAMSEAISDILYESISFYDYGESFYHGIMLGILQGIKHYVVDSNRESGAGRYDLALRPKSLFKPVYIFELKYVKNVDKLDEMADEAICQIEKNDYARRFRDMGYKKFYYYGIAFCRKDCVVRFKDPMDKE